MKLLVGLGNPGAQYAQNRHNVGFMVLDALANNHGASSWRRKFQGLTADAKLGGERAILLKPQTYMNESGRSVREAARFLKIPLEDIIVFYDEIDLAAGKLKVKTGGGNAGHNGLKSISAHLGNDYVRVRLGVGHPGDRGRVANYVLSDFHKSEAVWLDPMIEEISRATPRLMKNDPSRFLNDVVTALAPEKKTKPKKKPPRKTDGASAKVEKSQKATTQDHAPASPRPTKQREEAKPLSSMAETLKKMFKGPQDKT